MRRIVVSLSVLVLAVAPSAVVLRPDPVAASQTCRATTPPPGNPNRSGILNALRPHVETMAGEDIEFVVERIRIACGWARVIVNPQTPGGQGNRYEQMDALFERSGGVWRMRQIACGEVDCAPAAQQYRQAYPNLPRSLLF